MKRMRDTGRYVTAMGQRIPIFEEYEASLFARARDAVIQLLRRRPSNRMTIGVVDTATLPDDVDGAAAR